VANLKNPVKINFSFFISTFSNIFTVLQVTNYFTIFYKCKQKFVVALVKLSGLFVILTVGISLFYQTSLNKTSNEF